MKEIDVITVGDVFIDLVLSGFASWPAPGEEVFAKRLHREIGGGAAITACGLAKLGKHVSTLAMIGSEDGHWFVERLGLCGVDTRLIHYHQGEPTGLTVSVSTAGDRSFFTYAGANKALHGLLADPQIHSELERARLVHLAFPINPGLLSKLTDKLHAAGCLVSIDVGYQKEWLTDEFSLRALREVDLFFPNEREATLITGQSDPMASLQALSGMGIRSAVLKLGAQGSMLIREGEIIVCPPQNATPIDTTGAGDCFDAGFIYGKLEDEPPERCLQIANICGALSTEGFGGIVAFPTLEQIQTELKRK